MLTARLDVSDFENILLDDITLSTIGNAHDGAVASLALYRADGVSGPWVQQGESIIFNTNGTVPGFARWQFSGTNRVTLTKGTATFLKFVPTYMPLTQNVSGLRPQFALTALHGVGAGSATELTPDVSAVIGSEITVLNAALSLALSPSSPGGQIVGGQSVQLMRLMRCNRSGTTTIEYIDFLLRKCYNNHKPCVLQWL